MRNRTALKEQEEVKTEGGQELQPKEQAEEVKPNEGTERCSRNRKKRNRMKEPNCSEGTGQK
jgi:hypothetical protein